MQEGSVKFYPILGIISMLYYNASSGRYKKPLQLLIADILDKYTSSSDKCLALFNSLGICT